jgi:thermitase
MRMLRLNSGIIVLALVTSFFGHSVFGKEVSFGARVTPSYPALPESVREKVENKKKTTVVSRVDPLLSQDWGLSFVGFFEAFTPLVQPAKSTTDICSKDLVVAVIDTGIDYTHPDLQENIWVNRGETGPWKSTGTKTASTCQDKSCNGIDDDGNGFVDDIVGWDFVNNGPLPYDTHGHGSHIAGIIAAEAANGFGSSGVCPNASIMALKYYDASGIGYNNLQNTVKAFQYAVKMGAHIINYSGGGADPALAERMAVEEAQKKGVLIVAAAGNDGHNNDYQPYYPASYPSDNIISVASINKQNQLLPSSNFGKTVNIAAPGLAILSSLPGGRFGTMSGTSQATAFVTGAAALIASQSHARGNHFDYRKIKQWVLAGAKPLKGNDNKQVLSAGILSVPGSLKIESEEEPRQAVPSIAFSPDVRKSPKAQ